MNTLKRPSWRPSSTKATLPEPSIGSALDGGLGYYDLVNPAAYTYVVVGPIPKANKGDDVFVLWEGTQVGGAYSIQDADLGKTFPVPVLNANLIRAGDGDKVLTYTVQYKQGGGFETSYPVPVKVKRSVPGGLDPDPETPHNENLVPADVSPTPVPPDATEVTIDATMWKNPAEGDQMVLSWNGAMFFADPLPPAPFPARVRVTLTARDVIDAGIGSAVPITWCIYDMVANWSGWAETIEVDVRVEDPGLLTAPRVGDKDSGWTQIDLVALGGSDVNVFTPDYEGAAKGDVVMVHAHGTALDGSKVIFDSAPQTMPSPGFGMTFKVPNATAKDLSGGEVRIWYTVTGKSDSHSVWLPVIGAAMGDLPAPLVKEAVDSDGNGVADWLDPAKADPLAHITIDYPTMARDDVVTLILEGTAADGSVVRLTYPQPQIGTPGPTTATVPHADILKFLNGHVDVYYQVTPYSRRQTFIRALGEPESEHLALRVRLAGATKPHPAPVLTDHWDNGIPDGGAVGLPTTRVNAQADYEYTVSGDEVTYTWVGPRDTQTNTYRVGATGALPPLDSAYSAFLEKNKEGRVIVSYSVRRGGLDPTEPSEKVTFRVTSYTEDFEDVPLGIVYPGKPLELGTMKIESSDAFWIRDNSLPPNLSRHVSISGNSAIIFLFPDDLREVRLDILNHGDGSTPFPEAVIKALDDDVTVLDQAFVAADSTWKTVTLKSPTRAIRRVIYWASGNDANFDNFVLTE